MRGPNIWQVDCRFTPPAGGTPSPCNYSIWKTVPDGTTAQKKAIAEAAATFDSTLVKNAAPSWVILQSAQYNPVYLIGDDLATSWGAQSAYLETQLGWDVATHPAGDTTAAQVVTRLQNTIDIYGKTAIVDATNTHYKSYMPIINIGRAEYLAGGAGSATTILAILKQIRKWTEREARMLILSIPPSSSETIGSAARTTLNGVNSAIAAAFPDADPDGPKFLDIHAQARSTTQITRIGLTPTSQDTTDITNGIIPSSLRSGTVGYNANGYAVLNRLVMDAFTAKGWL